jgi:hypothetical protein
MPIIKLKKFLSTTRDVQFTVCPELVGIGESFPIKLQIKSMQLSLPQIYSYLQLIKGL